MPSLGRAAGGEGVPQQAWEPAAGRQPLKAPAPSARPWLQGGLDPGWGPRGERRAQNRKPGRRRCEERGTCRGGSRWTGRQTLAPGRERIWGGRTTQDLTGRGQEAWAEGRCGCL